MKMGAESSKRLEGRRGGDEYACQVRIGLLTATRLGKLPPTRSVNRTR